MREPAGSVCNAAARSAVRRSTLQEIEAPTLAEHSELHTAPASSLSITLGAEHSRSQTNSRSARSRRKPGRE